MDRTDLGDRSAWLFYWAGVLQGTIRVTPDGVRWAGLDPRRRTRLGEDAPPSPWPFTMPLGAVERLLRPETASWNPAERVRLPGHDAPVHWERHLTYTGTVQGHEVTSQIWALRGDTALDVVTVAQDIVGLVRPSRYGLEVLVQEGFEAVTPLTVYDDPTLSPALFGVNDLGTHRVAMRDGVTLATDVCLPEQDGRATPVPVILVRTCYDRKRNRAALERWVARGYALVVQDVRGRSDSDGELWPFYYERDDGFDTVDWITRQPWCNGRVGLWGNSYLGYTAVAAATSGHPNIQAVVDEVNVGSPFVDTVRRGGTLCAWPLLSWTLAQSVGNRTNFDVFRGTAVDAVAVVDTRPIREIPQKVLGHPSGPWDLWAQHPEYDDFWRRCTLSEYAAHLKTPMLVISGWYDGDAVGVSETWRILSQQDAPHRRIWLGPWEHHPNRARDLLDVHLSADAVVYDYDVQILRWFDAFLKRRANGVDREPRARYYIVGGQSLDDLGRLAPDGIGAHALVPGQRRTRQFAPWRRHAPSDRAKRGRSAGVPARPIRL